jgi:predicted ATP-dependent endonuclease of OLD family
MFKSIEILGLRGFATHEELEFAIPDGRSGSGLTVIVGANNSGKSTAIEAMRAFAQNPPPSFTRGRRNQTAGDCVEITLRKVDDRTVTIRSQFAGTSETVMDPQQDLSHQLFILPSRRVFAPYFGKANADRASYTRQQGFPPIRTSSLDQFSFRLFEIQKNRSKFDALMAEVVEPVPQWTIDQEDSGNFFLKLFRDDAQHSSEGMGEGLVSLIFIIDALYDSEPGHCILIDEPELSLHPALQRRLARLLERYAADRQIVLATHSPFFVNFGALANGARIARVHIGDCGSKISMLSARTAQRIEGILRDQNNPHVLGLNAQEAFFLEDKVILVEGQEDVVFMDLVERSLGIKLEGEMFGWGVGGADKMGLIASILHELGFTRVAGILDGDKIDLAAALRAQFPSYHFATIPAPDIRTKPKRNVYEGVQGLLDATNNAVRPEHIDDARECLSAVNKYLCAPSVGDIGNKVAE